ncbi:MAG TPA: hypothetical protein VFO91_16655 [Anaerolineales bacterium]|nr:hypothetical protein [Anaerolineales bacterium]
MNLDDLEKLNTAVEFLINQKSFVERIEQLSEEIDHSHESFVWSVIDLVFIDRKLPECIRSCWLFVLKKDVWTGCHYHPDSIQHMVMVNGQGVSKVAGIQERMIQFGSSNNPLADIWYVIDKGVPHEFFPEDSNMVVISFHTCEAKELEEVDCGTGEKRRYEKEN